MSDTGLAQPLGEQAVRGIGLLIGRIGKDDQLFLIDNVNTIGIFKNLRVGALTGVHALNHKLRDLGRLE